MVAAGCALAVGCGGGGKGSGGIGATRSACAANQKGLHDVLVAYANDWDDVLPGSDWNDALVPYLATSSATLRCPSLSEGVGYAMSGTLIHASINSVPDPDAVPLLFDTADRSPNVVGPYTASAPLRHGGPAAVFLSGRTRPELAAE